MSTNALIDVYEGDDLICTIRKHWDGYPSETGRLILYALGGRRLVNGIPHGEGLNVVNGMGDAAAILIAHLKHDKEAGDVTLIPAGTRETGEEYIYTVIGDVYHESAGISLRVEKVYPELTVLYEGPLSLYIPPAP